MIPLQITIFIPHWISWFHHLSVLALFDWLTTLQIIWWSIEFDRNLIVTWYMLLFWSWEDISLNFLLSFTWWSINHFTKWHDIIVSISQTKSSFFLTTRNSSAELSSSLHYLSFIIINIWDWSILMILACETTISSHILWLFWCGTGERRAL